MRVVDVVVSPPYMLTTNAYPHLPRHLALTISPVHHARCLSIGSDVPSEGELHCATSLHEAEQWRERLRVAAQECALAVAHAKIA